VDGQRPSGWHAWVAQTPSADAAVADAPADTIGYAAITLAAGQTTTVVGDAAALQRDTYGWAQVLPALVRTVAARVHELGGSADPAGPQLWIRHVGPGDLDYVAKEAHLERQLAVLGRQLDAPVDIPSHEAQVRTYVPDT